MISSCVAASVVTPVAIQSAGPPSGRFRPSLTHDQDVLIEGEWAPCLCGGGIVKWARRAHLPYRANDLSLTESALPECSSHSFCADHILARLAARS